MEVTDDNDDNYNEYNVKLDNEFNEMRDALERLIKIEDDSVNTLCDAIKHTTSPASSVEEFTEEMDTMSNNSIKHKSYVGAEHLFQDLNYHANMKESGGCIHICGYQINTQTDIPFLQFMMYKYDASHTEKPDEICFPSYSYDTGTDVYTMSKTIIELMFRCFRRNFKYTYKGFHNIGSDYYVFYDFTESSIDSYKLSRKNDLWMVLIDEIINYKEVCGFPINISNSEMFINQPELCYLYSVDKLRYEVPIVGYIGVKRNNMEFISVFGNPKTENSILPGSYYYFTDYKHSYDMVANIEYSINEKGGNVRFAIFLGRHNAIVGESFPDNMVELLDEENDSIFILNRGFPFWIVNDYESHVPMSYHNIELCATYDVNNKNYIS